MVYKLITLVVVICLAVGAFFYFKKEKPEPPVSEPIITQPRTNPVSQVVPDETVLLIGLSIPWDIAFVGTTSDFLISERAGNLLYFKDGVKNIITLPHPVPKGEGGLLGIALHPHFAHNNLLYLYMTTSGGIGETKNAVYRYEFINGELTNELVIIKDIPGALYHDGGRIDFGPDEKLYITTGDAQSPVIAQNLKSLGGKILRLEDDGEIPADNPFGTAVWSYGHRNPQGLAWDHDGKLWQTEHGRSGAVTGYDELNQIVRGANYGWPSIEGSATKSGMTAPVLHSGSDYTWAPASALYYRNRIFFGGLKGEALYEYNLDTKEIKRHFEKKFGRIRTIRKGKDGMFYLLTSNRDGRGTPTADDDRLIQLNPDQFFK